MNLFIHILLILAIAALFCYGIYKILREASGTDCANCAMGNSFDYGMSHKQAPKSPVVMAASGRTIITDERAARERRERIRKLMELGKK